MKKFRFLMSFLLTSAVAFALSAAAPLPLLSPAKKAYLATPREQRIALFGDEVKRKEIAGNWHPETVSLALPEKGAFELKELGKYGEKERVKTLTVGDRSVKVPAYVLAEAKEGKLVLGNLKMAASYQWTCGDAKGEFATEDVAPRLLLVDKIPNVRDLGGRMTGYGVRVKQGLIYRTAGLNQNAEPITKPDAELHAKNPGLAHQLESIAKLQKRYRSERNRKPSGQEPAYLPCTKDKKWVVFCPERELTENDYMQLESLKSIPEILFGAKPETVTANDRYAFKFPKAKYGSTAIFFREINSEEEGVMQAGIGADKFFRVYFNGALIFDQLNHSSRVSRVGRSNNTINLPVRKGANLLIVPVGSGHHGWSLSFGPLSKPVPRNEVAKKLYEKQKQQVQRLAVASGRFLPGENRFTPEGRRYFVEDLGVRSDLDLRTAEECMHMTGSPAGPEVHWYFIPSNAYGGLDSSEGRKAFVEDFKLFLDEKNYPIAFHCIAGQDRTGTLAFVLNGLLGVPEEQLFLDWEVSIFWNSNIGFGWNRIEELYKTLGRYPGKTINDRIEAYVLARGFTKEDIAKFRKLMLEER